MRLFKRITILILILLLSLYWMPTALAVGETSPYTTDTEDGSTEDEKDEETEDEKEPEVVEKPVYI